VPGPLPRLTATIMPGEVPQDVPQQSVLVRISPPSDVGGVECAVQWLRDCWEEGIGCDQAEELHTRDRCAE
jgi:hypothetical protein